MSFSGAHGDYRIDSDSATLTVASAAGTVVSTAVFGSQTRAVLVTALGTVSSSSAVRIKIAAPADSVVSSTLGALLPVNWPMIFKVTPGQRLMALGNDAATTYTMTVTPLTD